MPYSLTILWCERNRFLPAILAVTFSALLIALQCGMLLGFLAATARPINHSMADLWVGSKNMPGLGFSEPIPEEWRGRLASQPEVESTEPFLYGVGVWRRPTGGTETCYIVGSRLGPDSIGALPALTPHLRSRLTVPGSVVVDVSALGPLGLEKGEGEITEVFKQRVRVVGVMQGGSTGLIPAVYCSLQTARMLLPGVREKPEQANYLLARCYSPEEAQAVARRLTRKFPQMATYTREQFASLTGLHWLTNTKAGIALGFAALLGFIVGAVITSQTLYAAVVASLKEYAVLRALGIPRWRIGLLVLVQSLWIGLIGVSLAIPAALGVAHAVKQWCDIEVILSVPLLTLTAGLTVVMALVSGITALRSLKHAEPIALLR
jgi:putative ABC transport system permease protein